MSEKICAGETSILLKFFFFFLASTIVLMCERSTSNSSLRLLKKRSLSISDGVWPRPFLSSSRFSMIDCRAWFRKPSLE